MCSLTPKRLIYVEDQKKKKKLSIFDWIRHLFPFLFIFY